MKTSACFPVLLLVAGLAVGLSPPAVAQQPPPGGQTSPWWQNAPQPPTVNDAVEPGGQPSIEISRLGPIDVERESRVLLTTATVDLAGEVWNYGPESEIAILWRPLGRGPWSVAATSEPVPGGLFEIAGIQFPDLGDYELIAGLFPFGKLTSGSSPAGDGWRGQARAVSRKLFVRIMALPPPLGRERPSLSILSVGGRSVHPQEPASVPAWGEVVVQAPNLSPGERVYLAVLSPSSDRCSLHGPARRGSEPGTFVFQGVSLEVPGDPRQGRSELIALVSAERLAAGPMSSRSLWRREALTSPLVEIVLEEKLPVSNSSWVPLLAITRIGRHELEEGEPPDRPLAVEQGDLLEAGLYERVPEGVRLWVLTRPRGSRLWLAQGPALLRGAASPEDFGQGPPEATWVWPGVRFENPVGEKRKRSGTSEEFEVLAVLSTTSLPASWIDSAALGSSFIQTVSPPVIVKVKPAEPSPEIAVSISRVGGEKADTTDVGAVGATERVEVSARGELPPSFYVYVARHPLGSSLWSLAEAIPQGKKHLVPALSFTNPHAEEGARYQLMAVVTRGLLPVEQLEYDDLVRFAVASSDAVTVRYESGGFASLRSRMARWWSQDSEKPMKGKTGMPWIWLLFVVFLVVLLAFLAFLAFLECRLRMLTPLARSAAGRIERGLAASAGWFSPPAVINPATFLLGIFLFGLVVSVIVSQYLPLYAEAVAVVTSLSPEESAGLALWLVLLTALAGVFLELAFDPAAAGGHPGSGKLLQIVLGAFLGLALVCLMLFQAFFYYTFLRKTAGGMIPVLGGMAFFLIAFIEAIAFFFITRLTLVPSGALAVRLLRAPFVLAVLLCRSIERFFENCPQRKQEKPS